MMKRPKGRSWTNPRRLIYNMWGSSAWRRLRACPTEELEKKITKTKNDCSRQLHPRREKRSLGDLDQL
jgi:hypothetical protein